jgi:hypothetical protein
MGVRDRCNMEEMKQLMLSYYKLEINVKVSQTPDTKVCRLYEPI